MSQVKLFSSSGGARVAKRSGRQKKQKVKKPLKTLAIWLLVILCLEGLYFFCIYTNNSFVKKWRTIYINTAMDTMRHQWLATYFIPKDVIDEVRYEYGLVKAGTVGKESTWGRTDPVPADQTPSTSYDSIVTLDPNVTHETDQPVAVPCGVPPPLPYHYTECACASQVAIQFMSNFSFAYAQNSPVKTQKPPIRTVD